MRAKAPSDREDEVKAVTDYADASASAADRADNATSTAAAAEAATGAASKASLAVQHMNVVLYTGNAAPKPDKEVAKLSGVLDLSAAAAQSTAAKASKAPDDVKRANAAAKAEDRAVVSSNKAFRAPEVTTIEKITE